MPAWACWQSTVCSSTSARSLGKHGNLNSYNPCSPEAQRNSQEAGTEAIFSYGRRYFLLSTAFVPTIMYLTSTVLNTYRRGPVVLPAIPAEE